MGIGPMHLFVLVVIALLFFGPSKLPALGKSMGEAIKGFKDAMNEVNTEADKISKNVAATPPHQPAAPAPTAIEAAIDVTHSANTSTETSTPKTPVS